MCGGQSSPFHTCTVRTPAEAQVQSSCIRHQLWICVGMRATAALRSLLQQHLHPGSSVFVLSSPLVCSGGKVTQSRDQSRVLKMDLFVLPTQFLRAGTSRIAGRARRKAAARPPNNNQEFKISARDESGGGPQQNLQSEGGRSPSVSPHLSVHEKTL